ncbi:MAG: histidine--tRNA ligase [Panacagrimonas sp.]
MKIQSIRGFNDILPQDAAPWQRLHDAARALFERYAYQEIRIPLVESIALFKRAVGEVTDVVEKEMYAFEDRGGESIALRPEFTAGVVRAGIQHGLFHNQQQRVWCTGPVFRYERPQAGRYRQFHQLNVEAYGIPGPDVDVELIAMSARLWRELGFENLRLEINSLGGPQTRARYRDALIAFLQQHEADLDEDARNRMHSNPLRVLDSKVPTTQAIVKDAPSIVDFLDEESATHLQGLRDGLNALGIEHQLNPRLVRGLDYYTRGVFEWITEDLGAQGTICAGGRYDLLVEQLGGKPTPAVGWAAGVERLILLMQKKADAPSASADIYVCGFGDRGGPESTRVAEMLRDALPPSLRIAANVGGGKPAAQLKRADRSGAALALVIGDAEADSGGVQVKFMRQDRPQTEIPQIELASTIAALDLFGR